MIEAVAGPRTADFAANNPGFEQDLEVLGYGRLRQRQTADDGTAATAIATDSGERTNDGKTSRMAQRLQAHRKQTVVSRKRHLVSSSINDDTKYAKRQKNQSAAIAANPKLCRRSA
jgi:hypothetical protein